MREATLATHNDDLMKLKEIANQIASIVGTEACNLLSDEIDALGRRLKNIQDSAAALKDTAERRVENENQCNEVATKTQAYLTNVQKVSPFNINKNFR